MVIQLKNKAYRKIKEYCKQLGESEIGGLLTGKIKADGDIIIKDAILLKQEVGTCTFEIDDTAIMNLTKNAEADFLESIIGWWHSHGNGETFWSGVDDDCFRRICDFSNRCFGIVVSNKAKSKKINMKCRYDTYDRDGNFISIDDIKPEMDWSEQIAVSTKGILANIKKKVKKSTYDNIYDTGNDMNHPGAESASRFRDYLHGN